MFIPENYIDIIIRLILSVVLGGLIGLERVKTNHDAGLRTHILVSLGSAGIMVLSEGLVGQFDGDISRIAAQVVSGIGFLGAGCIIVNGNRIKGLTTAAGLWATACVGLCAGIGYYFVALLMTLLMLGAMIALAPIANKLAEKAHRHTCTLRVLLIDEAGLESLIKRVNLLDVSVSSLEKTSDKEVKLKIECESNKEAERLILSAMTSKHIAKVERV